MKLYEFSLFLPKMQDINDQFRSFHIIPPPTDDECESINRARLTLAQIRRDLNEPPPNFDGCVNILRWKEEEMEEIIRHHVSRARRYIETQKMRIPIELMRKFNTVVHDIQSDSGQFVNQNQSQVDKLKSITDKVHSLNKKIEEQKKNRILLPGYRKCVGDVYNVYDIPFSIALKLNQMEALDNEDLERELHISKDEVSNCARDLQRLKNQKNVAHFVIEQLDDFKQLGEEIASFFNDVECVIDYDQSRNDKGLFLYLMYYRTENEPGACNVCEDIKSWGSCFKVKYQEIPM